MDKWLAVLHHQIEAHGVRATAGRLEVSPATISQIKNGKTALSANVQTRIARVFGREEMPCPILGPIKRDECIKKHTLAVAVGGRATGNPMTLRLFRTCLICTEWDGGWGGEES